MSLFHKSKTALQIVKTKGLTGVIQTIRAKFDRSFRPDETLIVSQLLIKPNHSGLMIDVGAHHGQSLAPFAESGWRIIAFEPDSHNRKVLTDSFKTFNNIIIDPRACSDHIQPEATLFTSDESSGVSGLSSFLDSHKPSESVRVTTLAAALGEHGFAQEPVDFLKVDTEGYDLMVLQGYPWKNDHHPMVILCEFENSKTEPLGYHFHDLADYLVEQDYQLIISEWYPIKAYGGLHQWRHFMTYPCQLKDPDGWGNIFAVKAQGVYDWLREQCQF